MPKSKQPSWASQVKEPTEVLARIEPGMSLFLGTGLAEPRTLVRHLMASSAHNLQDLTLVQIVSLGDLLLPRALDSQKLRLKTFFSGWVASDAIAEGRVDLISSRFSQIPCLIKSGRIPIDVAFVQITPPNEAGYVSLGVANDVARQAMEQASFIVGEISDKAPFTYGDTLVPVTDFHMLIRSTDEPFRFARWPVDEVFDRVAANVASVIDDGDCLAFSLGPLYEALSRHLVDKHDLGIHSPFFADPMMDLVKSGAVTNRNKEVFRGRSLASYAFGTQDLMNWLDHNPLVDFQSIDKVFDPIQIGRNPQFLAIFPARKVDLAGNIALHIGKGSVSAGPAEAIDFVNGAELSRGGRVVFALPSRNRKGESNILLSVENFPNVFGLSGSVDKVITEYGVAHLRGRTMRERAQAIIDIAHPGDRPALVEQAKDKHILYEDQIFFVDSALLYPVGIEEKRTVKKGTTVRFRAIKPSDEEEMRRLFYRFSDEAVYSRYFRPIKTMPHNRMQEYVNIDYQLAMSIVGMIDDHVIAEARYAQSKKGPYADVAFVVDEHYQGLGIASHLYKMLIRVAKEHGLQGFNAEVLATNKAMLAVFKKAGLPMVANLDAGVYELTIPFSTQAPRAGQNAR